jgi:hypothetical protein
MNLRAYLVDEVVTHHAINVVLEKTHGYARVKADNIKELLDCPLQMEELES